MINKRNLLPKFMPYILKDIEVNFQRNHCVADEDLLSLFHFFGSTAEKALELLEKDCVKQIVLEKTSKYLFQITGSSNITYYLYPNNNTCHCLAFIHFVLIKKTQMTCKHVLACRLAVILEKITKFEVNPTEYSAICNCMAEDLGISDKAFKIA